MKLHKFQLDGLERVENHNKVAFYWEMGTGKTFVGAEKMVSFGTRKNLVVCQKSKIADWIEHFTDNYEMNVFNLTKSSDFNDFVSVKNSVNSVKNEVGVINYDLIFRRAELLKLTDFSLMLDESSMIQNDTAKRTKAILKLKADNIVLLSGTPVGGKYENLYSQLRLLDWKLTKREYWNSYINWKLVQYGAFSPMIPKIIGYKNVDELKQMLHFYGADFLRSDEVFELPQQNFNVVSVPTSREYKHFRSEKFIKIGETEFIGDTPLKTMLYARMLCGAYNKDKINAFVDLCDSTDDRLIVFYNFNNELSALKKAIGNRPYSVVNGSERDLSNYENVDNSITFIQYQAGAMGLNLQKANKIIYFTLPLSSELFEQSKKRTHRIGQNRPCFYYTLICEKSIETKIAETLETRNDYTQKLFDKDF